MRAYLMLPLAATLTSAILTSAAEFNPADARMSLSQCRSKEVACHRRCTLGLNGQEANSATFYRLKQCLNNCDSNHAACVDFSMSSSVLEPGRGKKRPPRGTNLVSPLGGGILDPSSGLNPQGPAATGRPVGGSGRPAQIR